VHLVGPIVLIFSNISIRFWQNVRQSPHMANWQQSLTNYTFKYFLSLNTWSSTLIHSTVQIQSNRLCYIRKFLMVLIRHKFFKIKKFCFFAFEHQILWFVAWIWEYCPSKCPRLSYGRMASDYSRPDAVKTPEFRLSTLLLHYNPQTR
jgi:hypothetical protein